MRIMNKEHRKMAHAFPDTLKCSIINVCKSAFPFKSLELDGIICVADQHGQQIVVKIHERIHIGIDKIHYEQPIREFSNNYSISKLDDSVEDLSFHKPENNLVNVDEESKCNSSPDNSINVQLDIKKDIFKSSPQLADMLQSCGPLMTSICRICAFKAKNVDSLFGHYEILHNLFPCLICFRTFTSRSNLDRHLRLHTGQKPFHCLFCDKTFSRKDHLSNHALKHSFKCSICLMHFEHPDALSLHMHITHDDLLSNLKEVCSHCNKVFNNHEIYMNHLKAHCSLQSTNDEQNEIKSIKKQNSMNEVSTLINQHMMKTSEAPLYSCLICNEAFYSFIVYLQHMIQHRQLPADFNIPFFPANGLLNEGYSFIKNSNSSPDSSSILSTNMTSKNFKDIKFLDNKFKTQEQSSLKSYLIGKRKRKQIMPQSLSNVKNSSFSDKDDFVDIESIDANVQETLNNDNIDKNGLIEKTILKLPIKRLTGSVELQKNIADDHNNNIDSSYNCQEPNITYQIPAVINDTEYKLKLKEEPKSWSASSPINAAAAGSAVGAHECPLCQLNFESFLLMDIHCFQEHGRSACMFCPKTFAQKANRDRHVCLHTGERPYSCPNCDERFSRGDKLKMHRIRLHGVIFPMSYAAKYQEYTINNDESLHYSVQSFQGTNSSDSSLLNFTKDSELINSFLKCDASTDGINLSNGIINLNKIENSSNNKQAI